MTRIIYTYRTNQTGRSGQPSAGGDPVLYAAHQLAAIRYSGRWAERGFQKHIAQLKSWVEAQVEF
jgi:hypothetical protein